MKDMAVLPESMRDCPWVDGRGNQVRIKIQYLEDVCGFLNKRYQDMASGAYLFPQERKREQVSAPVSYLSLSLSQSFSIPSLELNRLNLYLICVLSDAIQEDHQGTSSRGAGQSHPPCEQMERFCLRQALLGHSH